MGFLIFFDRFSKKILINVECLLRTDDAAGATVIVTQIRERAFKKAPEKAIVTGIELKEGSDYDYGLRTESVNTSEGGFDIMYGRFLDELAWEFNQEGRRRQDMIRFGVYTTKSFFAHSPNGDYRSLYPIPRGRLETSTNLHQNPGYLYRL